MNFDVSGPGRVADFYSGIEKIGTRIGVKLPGLDDFDRFSIRCFKSMFPE